MSSILPRISRCSVRCSVLQCLAVCCSVDTCRLFLPGSRAAECCSVLQCLAVCCSVLQSVAVCCRVLQSVAECCRVLQCVAVCCSVLQCVAVCCSVLQCVAFYLACAYQHLKFGTSHFTPLAKATAIKHLRTRSAAVRHWRDISPGAYERDLVTPVAHGC